MNFGWFPQRFLMQLLWLHSPATYARRYISNGKFMSRKAFEEFPIDERERILIAVNLNGAEKVEKNFSVWFQWGRTKLTI
jgi:hypothetical protein